MKTFSISDMQKAGFSKSQAKAVMETVATIQLDEASHLKSLSGAVTALGGSPATDACKFDLAAAMKDVSAFTSCEVAWTQLTTRSSHSPLRSSRRHERSKLSV